MECSKRAIEGLEHHNLKQWHEAGYKGINYVAWNMENLDESTHGQWTAEAIAIGSGYDQKMDFINVCPSIIYDAKGFKKIKIEYNGCIWQGTEPDNDTENAIERFIRDNGIDTIGKSLSGSKYTDQWLQEFWNRMCRKYNLTIFGSAGNEGGSDTIDTAGNNGFGRDNVLVVGSIRYDAKYNKYVADGYSESGEDLDFMMMPFNNQLHAGTSFDRPSLQGLVPCIWEFTGKMTNQYTKEFLIDICKDLKHEGFDWRTGYGMPLLPDLNNPWVQFAVGKSNIIVNGKAKVIDQPAIIDEKTNRTLVPVRAFCEGLGCKVEWDASIQHVKIKDEFLDHIIEITIGSSTMIVDGRVLFIEQPAIIMNDRTMLPFRCIAEALGAAVAWSEIEGKVTAFRLTKNHKKNMRIN